MRADSTRHQTRRLLLLGSYALGEDLFGDIGLSVTNLLEMNQNAEEDIVDDEYSEDFLEIFVKAFNTKRDDAIAVLDGYLDRPIDELSQIERNCLVLAIIELTEQPETPKAVVISEWVSLSQEYGSEKGYRLVNAILDRIEIKR